jgi:hypothetical protein
MSCPQGTYCCVLVFTLRFRAASIVHVPRPYTPLDRTRASSSAFVDGASSHATPLSPQVNCCLLRHFSILWVFMPFCKARPGDVNGESVNSHLHKIENHAVGASAADDGRADGRSKSSGCSGYYRYVVFSTWTCTFCKLVFLFQECWKSEENVYFLHPFDLSLFCQIMSTRRRIVPGYSRNVVVQVPYGY